MEYDVKYYDDELIIRDKKGKYQIDLRQRIFDFAVNSMVFIGTLPKKKNMMFFAISIQKVLHRLVLIMKKHNQLH
ncbi:MAG: hypothetical protein R6V04_02980 [bacterium]